MEKERLRRKWLTCLAKILSGVPTLTTLEDHLIFTKHTNTAKTYFVH